MQVYFPVLFITITLLVIPFFWMKPEEMDLGGDSSRLYFYDPASYLRNFSLYGVVPEGTGVAAPNYYFLPFVGALAIVKFLVRSPYVLISLFNGFKLSVAYLSMYLIIRELISSLTKRGQNKSHLYWSALVAGLFYVFSPAVIGNFDKALLSHNQIFLNPLMFYLLLRYLLTKQNIYLWSALMTSLVFAPNFAYTSAPAFFSFYPLSIVFLLLYVVAIRKQHILWKGLIIGFILFLGLQAFHLIPQLINLFEPGSFANARVFDKDSIAYEGIRYFTAILPLAKVSTTILVLPAVKGFASISLMAPLIVIVGLILNKGKYKGIILTAGFFLVTIFLASANITTAGVSFYKNLFYLPGFSMFRNFIGQWQFVLAFFYALLFGQALAVIFSKIKGSYRKALSIVMMLFLISGVWPFINGSLVNKILWQSKDVRIAMKMDPRFEETLAFIRNLPEDGKILTLPLTDSFYQVVHGVNNGAYVGPSMISYLTGKKDFSGYQILLPFSEEVMRAAREKNYQAFTRVLALLNIKYIFHNSDPRIYEEKFPGVPYTYMRTSMPATQNEYEEFLSHLPVRLIYTNGLYNIYKLDDSVLLPEVYAATHIVSYSNSISDLTNIVATSSALLQTAFIDDKECAQSAWKDLCTSDFQNSTVFLATRRISPVAYEIKARIPEAKKGFFWVFNNAFHPSWQLSIGSNIVPPSQHIMVNGYANAWYISEDDVKDRNEIEFKLEMTAQRFFHLSLIISVITLTGCILWAGQRIIRSLYAKKFTR